MITPNDIATKDFKKVAVGYSPEEVDTFLDDIYEDYEKLYKESLKEKTAVVAPVPVADDTDRFKHLEKSIERTLSFAESAAAETKAAAQAEADAILSAAKTQAAEIISAARAYLAKNKIEKRVRFDVIEVYLERTDKNPIYEIKHLEDAFRV